MVEAPADILSGRLIVGDQRTPGIDVMFERMLFGSLLLVPLLLTFLVLATIFAYV